MTEQKSLDRVNQLPDIVNFAESLMRCDGY